MYNVLISDPDDYILIDETFDNLREAVEFLYANSIFEPLYSNHVVDAKTHLVLVMNDWLP